MAQKMKTAVVGCGMISSIYLKNLKGLFSNIDLVAIANRNPDAAREKAQQFGIDRVLTIDEVAAAEDIDLVVNLTPVPAHYGIIRTMLEAGKHVYTEKTFTETVEQAKELCALADAKGLYVGVAPDTVLGAGIQTARRAIDTDMIGQVTSGVVVINRDQNLNSEVFRFLQQEGGALAHDVGIYYIAALVALLGPVRAIRAFGRPAPVHAPQLLHLYEPSASWQIPGYNLLSASLEFENGALVSVLFDGNTIGASQHVFTLFGTRGILKIGDPNTFDGPNRLVYEGQEECPLPFTHGYNGHNTLEPAPFDHYGHRGIGVSELAYAISAGRPNRLSKEFGLHCMEVLMGMDRAAESGETVMPVSRFEMRPLAPGYYSSMMGGAFRADAERSLIN